MEVAVARVAVAIAVEITAAQAAAGSAAAAVGMAVAAEAETVAVAGWRLARLVLAMVCSQQQTLRWRLAKKPEEETRQIHSPCSDAL